jgi:signal transduction histidine kinase
VLTTLLAFLSTDYILQPTKALWQAVLHIAPGNHGVLSPNLAKLKVGHDLVASLTSEIYQFVTQAEHLQTPPASQAAANAEAILSTIPLPIVVLNNQQTISYANEPAARYLNTNVADIVGKNFYSIFNLSFTTANTLDNWLHTVSASTALASQNWSRVRLTLSEEVEKQFDLAAHFSKDNPSGNEVTLVLFDHSDLYGQDDQAASLVALSVHELRTPLTLLRGYIEVFDDELKDTLSPELSDFMDKMTATAEQLTAFVSNILNAARVDNDQLVLTLQEEDWANVLSSSVKNLELRARVRGIELHADIADNLPAVGVDRVSIFEVMNNLVDNAIKYSGSNKTIEIKSQLNQEGLIETTVKDFGVGIPTSIIPNLFDKYYRNFHNRAQIGGTGLGLYLCKAIIQAHGGNIWVRSHEGEGTTFGFTLLPYSQLAEEQKNGNNNGIVRGAHGWIKNHSLYRN